VWSAAPLLRRVLGFALAALALCPPAARAEDFEQAFGRAYERALRVVADRQQAWMDRLTSLGADAGTLVPVVFPELLRHSPLRAEVENAALATLYIARGARAADFSVGLFQMKPSFVERLEEAVAGLADAPEALSLISRYPAEAGEAARRGERYRRLCREDWQLLYLAGMERVVLARFPLEGLSREEMIRFLAAAYNHGFWRPREEILAAEDWRLFPTGGLFGRPAPFRYTDVAVDFYRRHWRALGF
jgi:hypothetical protein